MAKKKSIDVINIDQLADMFGLPKWDIVHDVNTEGLFAAGDYARKEALREGATEDEADDAGFAAEQRADEALFGSWYDAVLKTAEDLFSIHGLELIAKGRRKEQYPDEYRIEPSHSWEDAADTIRLTINGYGEFHISSLKEFLASGPYTARQAVLRHLHWIRYYPEIYGEPTPPRAYEHNWRDPF